MNASNQHSPLDHVSDKSYQLSKNWKELHYVVAGIYILMGLLQLVLCVISTTATISTMNVLPAHLKTNFIAGWIISNHLMYIHLVLTFCVGFGLLFFRKSGWMLGVIITLSNIVLQFHSIFFNGVALKSGWLTFVFIIYLVANLGLTVFLLAKPIRLKYEPDKKTIWLISIGIVGFCVYRLLLIWL